MRNEWKSSRAQRLQWQNHWCRRPNNSINIPNRRDFVACFFYSFFFRSVFNEIGLCFSSYRGIYSLSIGRAQRDEKCRLIFFAMPTVYYVFLTSYSTLLQRDTALRTVYFFLFLISIHLLLCLCVYINYTWNVRVFHQRIYANTSILLLYFFIQMLALHSFKSIQISKHWLRRLFLCCSILYCATVIIYGSLWWFRIFCMLHLSNVLVHSHLHFCIYNRTISLTTQFHRFSMPFRVNAALFFCFT